MTYVLFLGQSAARWVPDGSYAGHGDPIVLNVTQTYAAVYIWSALEVWRVRAPGTAQLYPPVALAECCRIRCVQAQESRR